MGASTFWILRGSGQEGCGLRGLSIEGAALSDFCLPGDPPEPMLAVPASDGLQALPGPGTVADPIPGRISKVDPPQGFIIYTIGALEFRIGASTFGYSAKGLHIVYTPENKHELHCSMNSRRILKMDTGFYIGTILWPLLNSLQKVHVLVVQTIAHMELEQGPLKGDSSL